MKHVLKYTCLFTTLQMTIGTTFATLGTPTAGLLEPSLGFVGFVGSFLLLLLTFDYPSRHAAYRHEMLPVQSHPGKAPHALAA